jgi:uncharacterized protein (TIGR02569 family)
VFKRADISHAEIAWQGGTLATARPQGLRLVVPLRSTEGAFVVEGWIAAPYIEGVPDPARWADILAVGRRLAGALGALPRPAFLDDRRTPWDVADHVAWGDEPIEALDRFPHIAALARLRGEVDASAQVIHGDLTGNVLFPQGLSPAVIDFVAYWRPRAYMTAIVVADVLVWQGAPDDVVGGLDGGHEAGQYLVRALLSRAIVEVLQQPDLDPVAAAAPFRHAVDVARTLIQAPSP